MYNRDSITAYFLVYVDDLILTGSDPSFIKNFVAALSLKFSLKDLGSLNFFLGVEVVPTKDGLFLSQQKYIRDLLERANMHGAKVTTTPMSTSIILKLHDGSAATDATAYRQLIGGL